MPTYLADGLPVYNADSSADREALVFGLDSAGRPTGWMPRRTVCGSPLAMAGGLVPVLDFPDLLVDPRDYKEVLADCHARKVFALYHQLNHGLLAYWQQGSWLYCWSWSLTAAVMDCRAVEGQRPVKLNPLGNGWMVAWRNEGYYCDEALAGVARRGIPSVEFAPESARSYRDFKPGWEGDALRYRPLESFDTRFTSRAAMIQQALSCLVTGRPGYGAWNWLQHAMEVIGLEWDESVTNNLRWVIRNSHGEKDPIRMTGNSAVPDELYVPRATIGEG